MKLLELFAMQDGEDQFDRIQAADDVQGGSNTLPIKKEKTENKPQGAKRKDAKRIAMGKRFKADNQGNEHDGTGETPENSPFSSSGMR